MASLNNIIIAPVVTEKSYALQESGYFSFWVTSASNKYQIATAFNTIYGHKPISVNILNIKGKTKTNWKNRQTINKSDRKKAIIFIGKDKKIESLKLNTK